MKTNINITNEAKVSEAIKKAEGRATARTITVNDIVCQLNKIRVPKSKLNGTVVHYNGAEHFPNAYKYRPECTHWIAENRNGRWYLTHIYRDTCPNRSTWRMEVKYSQEAIDWLIKNESYIW